MLQDVPVIFASSILMFPATIAQFLSNNPTFAIVTLWLSPGSLPYSLFYISLIVFFTFFWTATQFRP
ncbi:MAG: preprotein translocase subunit SecY, partial [Flavobacteriales bacterium]